VIWVVDTCVLIDLLKSDPVFSKPSALALQTKLDETLVIAPITYVELAPAFKGDARAQDEFLESIWVGCDYGGSREAVLTAHRAWYEHVQRKRSGTEVRRPIADVLIGAYAMQKGGLITRNEDDFRSLYPALNIFNPVKANT